MNKVQEWARTNNVLGPKAALFQVLSKIISSSLWSLSAKILRKFANSRRLFLPMTFSEEVDVKYSYIGCTIR